MATTTLKVTLQQKYDTDANWAAKDPVLLAGEIAFSYDKDNDYKVGDGVSRWAELPYNAARYYSAATAITAGFCERCRYDAQDQEIHTTYIKGIENGSKTNELVITKGDGTTSTVEVGSEVSEMTGATASDAGTSGVVPAPAAGKQDSFLKGDGTWAVPTDTTYNKATDTDLGLVRIYSSTGTNTDGPMDQKSTSEELSNKVDTIKIDNVEQTKTNGVVNLPAYPTELPASNTVSTYDEKGTAPINGIALASALVTYTETTGAKKIATGNTAPTGQVAGDVWIETK